VREETADDAAIDSSVKYLSIRFQICEGLALRIMIAEIIVFEMSILFRL